jgi:predicted GH43/DUF377 family glycosyl hydrolase
MQNLINPSSSHFKGGCKGVPPGESLVKVLERYPGNPILGPSFDPWQRVAVFNPAVCWDGSKVHILYRAIGVDLISRLGYASSADGVMIDNRISQPVLSPEFPWESWGCEDPRITRLDDTHVLTYTAYSRGGPRVALATTQDFKTFKKLGLLGPDMKDKNAVFFPERIGGKVAMLHRIGPAIQIAFADSLKEFSSSNVHYWGDYVRKITKHVLIWPNRWWEREKIGAGPPPMKTEEGWLLFYHGVDRNRWYRMGAVLLDLDNPHKIIARTKEPLLEPQETYERFGLVPNVLFPTGAYVKDKTLYVYYGAADRTCGVAMAPLDEFLDFLKKEGK